MRNNTVHGHAFISEDPKKSVIRFNTSLIIEPARLGFIILISFWNWTSSSAAVLPRHFTNFKVTKNSKHRSRAFDDVIKRKHVPPVTVPLCGEFAGHRWILLRIPLTKASGAELWCFSWSAPAQTVEWTIETPVKASPQVTYPSFHLIVI